jgi:hypothetical protein
MDDKPLPFRLLAGKVRGMPDDILMIGLALPVRNTLRNVARDSRESFLAQQR